MCNTFIILYLIYNTIFNMYNTFIILYLIGASLSEPHTSRVNEIPSRYIYRYDFLPLKLL